MKLLPHERNMITKFRCNNIKLPIETGRWSNTPREERICHLCNVGFAHDTHIASILSTTGCLRFSLKMDFEVKTSR